jgi:hypothetical protein
MRPPHLCGAGVRKRDRRSCTPRPFSPCSNTVTPAPTNNSMSIFEDGRLRPGIYKIMNIVSQTYVDIREHTKELCGRPATLLEGKGLVGSCFRLAAVVAPMSIFSGKSSLLDPDIPYAGYSIEPRFTLPCAERGDNSLNQASLVNSATCSMG